MGDRIDPGDVLADEGARLSDWLGGLLVRGLSLPEGLTVDQHAREMAGARAAVSGLAGEVWDAQADGGTGIVERIQAAQFVSAHAAAMDWQAEANRRDLPPHARQTCQRLARQLMALTTAQLGGLCRLKAERRRERAEAARLAEQAARRAERETTERFKARAADVRAMIAGFEQTGRELARADREALAAAGAAAGPDAGPWDADLDAMAEFDEMAERAFPMAARPPGPPGAAPDEEPPPAPGSAGGFADLPSPKRSFSFAQAGTSAPPRQAKPEPVGAGVPEPPPEPPPPMNRQ
ncbi:MAG: hypothetical protein OEU09_09565 [Rhodospirillales bacterium]|nr:hypothetical protein [Rhodospirillales bacterium]